MDVLSPWLKIYKTKYSSITGFQDSDLLWAERRPDSIVSGRLNATSCSGRRMTQKNVMMMRLLLRLELISAVTETIRILRTARIIAQVLPVVRYTVQVSFISDDASSTDCVWRGWWKRREIICTIDVIVSRFLMKLVTVVAVWIITLNENSIEITHLLILYVIFYFVMI